MTTFSRFVVADLLLLLQIEYVSLHVYTHVVNINRSIINCMIPNTATKARTNVSDRVVFVVSESEK